MSNEGLKHDSGKQPWYAMPLEVLEPLADVFAAGEKKYATFNCLYPFKDGSRRFYDGQMRHTVATQRDPLAIDKELKEKYGVEVYELAQVAFNALMRLYHAKRESREASTSRIDIDLSELGKDRIDIGKGAHMVLVKPGEPNYREGHMLYRFEPYGAELNTSHGVRIVG